MKWIRRESHLSCSPVRIILTGGLALITQVGFAQMDHAQVNYAQVNHAQVDQDTDSLQRCYTIKESNDRLSCYDNYVKTLVSSDCKNSNGEESRAEPSGTVGSVERCRLADEKRFGASQLKQTTAQVLEPRTISAQVIKVAKDKRNIRTFHLDNGQIWRQIESGFVSLPKGEHFNVVVSKGSLGGYRLRINGKGKMIKVRRIL
jgi:hypothetical protein